MHLDSVLVKKGVESNSRQQNAYFFHVHGGRCRGAVNSQLEQAPSDKRVTIGMSGCKRRCTNLYNMAAPKPFLVVIDMPRLAVRQREGDQGSGPSSQTAGESVRCVHCAASASAGRMQKEAMLRSVVEGGM